MLPAIGRMATALWLPAVLIASGRAYAVPAFATQTGQPCATCHIGAFGPQLTPFGREFKLGGYALRGGDGLAASVPLAAMAIGSFNRTQAKLPPDQVVRHFDTNNNPALDQLSVFLAGGVGDHSGGFVQFTYSGIGNAANLDNVDLRPYTTSIDVGSHELRLGITVNNAPTVQDGFNSSYAWGYPYVSSGLAPTPAAQPVLAGAFAQNSAGYTVYMRLDRSLYLEAGVYTTLGGYLLARTGNTLTVGGSQGVMPYLRAAYEWNWNGQAAHIGGIYFQSNVNPAAGAFSTTADFGRDHYSDYAADAGYQWLGDGTHIVTVQGIYTHEVQDLKGTAVAFNNSNGTAFAATGWLDQIRLDAAYWFENTYGLTLAWQKTWGPANPVLFQPAPVTGSANGKPDSNAFILEADWVPFGKPDSLAAPWLNLKLGVQYVLYTQFNGRASNYDGFGRGASGNNTLFLFGWVAF
jgi:hypothetical protein